MKTNVIDNDGIYNDDNMTIVVSYDDKDDYKAHYMCYDKKNQDTLPLGACPWCQSELD